MNMDELNGDTVVQCPYDKSHKIARCRLQRHLVKCEKQYPETFREICPFNATHRFSKLEMQEHIEKCPMRRFMQPELYQKYRYHGSIKPWQSSEVDSNVDLKEYWEDDCESLYKPEDNSMANNSIQVSKEDQSYKCVVRRPLGYAEAMMIEPSEGNSVLEDFGSVISAMGMGRGTPKASQDKLVAKIGLGRGTAIKDDK
ncbi:gametocyte-specific factor 1 isoform X1 [Belonocnema kinseyi]|uniref:gametocyte-specific factor 1 isoform X1 n=1 Tax=Belonocnema kinseyi TaxID=2817044 RepID=UPI00143D621A|nr:gametocyte-specific factor 1 isoform X1 [Belonocnema kinseyi]